MKQVSCDRWLHADMRHVVVVTHDLLGGST